MDHDLIVIGGGTAGMAAALGGVGKGARTLLVEQERIGGDCTFMGCVPSKTLIAAAARGTPFSEAMAAVHRTVERIAATEDDEVFRRAGVEVVRGRATFRSADVVEVDGRPVRGRRFVLATGCVPAVPPVAGLEDAPYLTNETVFDLERLPGSLAVLGGGAIGCELAQAFRRLGWVGSPPRTLSVDAGSAASTRRRSPGSPSPTPRSAGSGSPRRRPRCTTAVWPTCR